MPRGPGTPSPAIQSASAAAATSDHPLAGGAGGDGDSAERDRQHREEHAERPALGWGRHRADDVILEPSAIDRGGPAAVGVIRGEASGPAVAPYSHPVVRLGCLISLMAALAAGLATGAWADADPASDMLYTGDVFLPYEPVSPAVAGELRSTVRNARAGGKPIKVAVIATKRDLGGVPTLFGNPLYYARFLGAELQFLYSGKLLVVMPQGAALSERGS